MNPNGSWVLPNIPANSGQVKARATCVRNGVTISGESAFFTVPANGVVNLPPVILGSATPIPVSLSITPTTPSLTAAGQTIQLTVIARYPDGSTQDATATSSGTNYTISNTAIATMGANGLVTAVNSGTVLVQAINDGASGILSVSVVLGGATNGGIPAAWAIANGLNPNDPTLPFEDPDRDGLTNLQEFQVGTNPNNPDTDGDGLSDGDEVNVYQTNPLLADTDGDGIPDGVEIRTATNPNDRNSYDLKAATASSVLKPLSFKLSTSPLALLASQQLSWRINLIDGKTTLDLTSDPRTGYSTSDVNACNFGAQKGLVFAGSAGSCVITISQNTLSVTVPGTIQSFTPTEVSALGISGAVAVDAAGTFAYVAAGSNGLVVVDVSVPTQPRRRGTLSGIGDAEAVRAIGQQVLVADANGFLRVVNAVNPDAPTLVASIAIAGRPSALALHGSMAAVAAQAGGISFVNIGDPTAPAVISTLAVPGTALGIDFDSQAGLAAVAMGSAGLQLVDISTPGVPRLRGLLPGGDVRRVLLKLPAALLADVQRSVTAVNVTNPDQPVLSSSIATNLGGAPVDIAAFGSVAITADTSFGRAIPVISVADPLQPNTVLFWTPSSAGFGSSIAVDSRFGYLIMPGTLRIFQYQDVIDTAAIAPTVQITSPLNGAQTIYGSTLTVSATATDDVAVAQVNFLVNGQVALATTAAPYQYTLTIPNSGSTLTLGANAIDFGNNTGTAANVTLNPIPDPLTAIAGTIVYGGQPVGGATVSCSGSSGVTGTDGTFAFTGIPTLRAIVCVAKTVTTDGITLSGSSASVTAVRGGTTQVGSIVIGPLPVMTSLSRKSALFNAVANLIVTGGNLAGATFSFHTSAITVTSVSINTAGTVATLSLSVGTGAGTFGLVATNVFGSSVSGVTPIDRFTVIDPNSTADTDRDGFPDTVEAVFGSDPLDSLSAPNANTPSAGEVDAPIISILKSGGTAPGQPTTLEVKPAAFSVLNSAGIAPGQLAAVEADATPFTALNIAAMTGGQFVQMAADGPVFSVLNVDVAAALSALQAGGSGGGIGGSGSSGGRLIVMEADALVFSVNNVAAGAPAAAQQAALRESGPSIAASSSFERYPVAVLESRPWTVVVGTIALNTSNRNNYFRPRDLNTARSKP